MPAKEPTREEVIAWLEQTGEPAHAAVDRYWPRLFGRDRNRKLAQVRQWLFRSRNPGAAAPPAGELVPLPVPAPSPERPPGFGAEEDPASSPRPPADYGTADLERVSFLRSQLAELLADLSWARSLGLLGKIAGLDARVSDVRRDLDQALAESGRTVKLERSPAAVAAEVLRRHRVLEELAARAGGD